eukprot:jgi/Botrbrau1/23236/Bobra.0041s0072.2
MLLSFPVGLQHILTSETPCFGKVYDALPPESRTARIRLLIPSKEQERTGLVLHLAGTGDHYFKRRLLLGKPLLSEGIATMALESPFYGNRRPAYQSGSKLHRVSDLLALGRATIEESLSLLNWAHENGFGYLGMSGFSMGGVHASMVASLYPGSVACVPLLAPRSAAAAFCKGALWEATAWKPLSAFVDEKEKDVTQTLKAAAQAGSVMRAASRVKVGDGIGIPHSNQQPRPLLSPPKADHSEEEGNGPGSALHKAGYGIVTKAADVLSDIVSTIPVAWRSVERSERSPTSPDLEPTVPESSSNGPIDTAENQLWDLWRKSNVRGTQELARWQLEQVLETYTDVTRFPRPRRPDACILVGAQEDAYVSQESVRELAAHWPGCEIRWVPGGHVSAFLLQQGAFRSAIRDALGRLSQPEPEYFHKAPHPRSAAHVEAMRTVHQPDSPPLY